METLYRAGLSNAASATVLALLVACLGRVLARRPAVLHCLWLLVLVKLVTPPLYEVPIPCTELLGWNQAPPQGQQVYALEGELRDARCLASLPTPSDSTDPTSSEAVLVLTADLDPDSIEKAPRSANLTAGRWSPSDWLNLACLIWLAGTVTTVAISVARIRRFQSLLREARPADDETQEWAQELAVTLGMWQAPLVCWTAGKLSPLVWSLGWRPWLIIPRDLWKGLDDHQRASLIIHELAHLRRGDHHVRIFELLVTALYWWHPVVWWVRQSLRDVEEQCCDAWVVWAFPDAAKSYAETLLETLDFLNQSELSEPLLASGFGKVHHLRKRLTMIMSGTTPRLVGLWGTLGSLALAAVLLPVNATWAQKPEDKKEVRIIVKTDDDAPALSEAFVSLDDVEPLTVIADLETVVTTAKPDDVRLEVKTDDSTDKVEADSLDEAIKKIKAKIKEIDKAANPSDGQKARKKSLERVVKELESAAKHTKQLGIIGDKAKTGKDVKAIVIRRIEDAKTLSPEKKAEIDKARSKVKELSAALQAKQKELSEARSQLSKLEAASRSAGGMVLKVNPALEAKVARLRELPRLETNAPRTVERRVVVERKAEAGKSRLEDLEKRLRQLLEEVATLKKDGAK